MMSRKSWAMTVAAGVLAAVFSNAQAGEDSVASDAVQPIVQSWTSATFTGLAVLPSCSSFAVDRGDPTTGPSMLIIKMKAGCVVPWHWHTAREELMLVSGTGKIDISDFPSRVVHQGDYILLPAQRHHQFACQTDCVFFDAISGKFDIHYIDQSGKEIPVQEALKPVSEMPGASQ